MTNQPNTPELDRQAAIAHISQQQGQFLDWLQTEKGYTLAVYMTNGEDLLPVHRSIDNLLAEYHDIDLDKVEEERRELLEWLRG